MLLLFDRSTCPPALYTAFRSLPHLLILLCAKANICHFNVLQARTATKALRESLARAENVERNAIEKLAGAELEIDLLEEEVRPCLNL